MINGQRWQVGFGYTGKTRGVVDDGVCRYHSRRIVVHGAHNGRYTSLEETVIHEVAHAAFPQIEEGAIDHMAQVAAKILFKMRAAEPYK